MNAAVTPLEALRRCVAVLKQVDYADCGESEALWCQHALALSEAESVLAAPVVPVAAQPAWKALSDVQWMNIVNHDRAYDQYSKEDAVHTAVKMTEAKCKELAAAPSLEAQPAGEVVRDAARLDFLDRCVMNHRCISAERDRDGTVGSPTYGDLPTVTIFTIPSQHKKGLGLRGAIDAAMAQGDKA